MQAYIPSLEARPHRRALPGELVTALLSVTTPGTRSAYVYFADEPARRLLVQPSHACTMVWRAIFPPLSSIVVELNTLVPSGYAQLCVKASRLPTAIPFSTL